MKKLRCAVIGVGYLGRFHAQKYAKLEQAELVGVVDVDTTRAAEIATEVGCNSYGDISEIIDEIDAVSIAAPTTLHYSVAKPLLERGIHCLVEKPMTATIEEAEELIAAAKTSGATLQVGHLERFNPALLKLADDINKPMFIEAHRISPFVARGADVDVILDIMIHDIDIILSLVKSPISSIEAVGVPVLTDDVDISNARLRFESGCIANITASRISAEVMRKIRIFQPDSYISIDCAKNAVDLYTLEEQKRIDHNHYSMSDSDALEAEIASFLNCILTGARPVVDGQAGLDAIKVAYQIKDCMVLPEK